MRITKYTSQYSECPDLNQRKPIHLPLLLHPRCYTFVCTLHKEVRMNNYTFVHYLTSVLYIIPNIVPIQYTVGTGNFGIAKTKLK